MEKLFNFKYIYIQAEKKLQEATLMFFVNNLATKEEKNELLKVFQSLDTNGDGKLSREELVIGYKKILNLGQEQVAEEEVNRIMSKVDKNNSGSIDYTGIYLFMFLFLIYFVYFYILFIYFKNL